MSFSKLQRNTRVSQTHGLTKHPLFFFFPLSNKRMASTDFHHYPLYCTIAESLPPPNDILICPVPCLLCYGRIKCSKYT